MKKLSAQFKKQIRDLLANTDFDQEVQDRFYRLLTLTPTDEERRNWERIGVLEGNTIHMGSDEMKDFGITIVLWDLAYQGFLERVSVG
jgi:cell wall assembly regulator SMI1